LTNGYAVSLTFVKNREFSGSDGTSRQAPVTSYFQPWYAQRRPPTSLLPNHSEAPRCAQNSSSSPYRPSESRTATIRSDNSLTRTGGQPSSGSSSASRAGIQ
jgi:hypothetical protein